LEATAQFLRPSDLASQLGLTRSRIYQLLRAGELPSVRIGGVIRIPREAWERWLAERRDEALGSVRRG
jgi:excisionase family DNA binding protein